MSPFQVDWMPGERILMFRTSAGLNIQQDTPAMAKSLIEALDHADHPVPCLLDLTETRLNFSDTAALLGKLTHEEGASTHPKLMELIVVTGDVPLRPAIDAQCGGRRVRIFPSVLHALTYTREKYDTMRISPN